MGRPFRGRQSDRDRKLAINASLRFLGIPLQNEIAPERKRKPRTASGRPLEKHALAKVLRALRADDRVERVERNQSGLFQSGNRTISVGVRGKLDVTAFLKNGRYAEIEVKRDQHTKPDERQMQRIESIKNSGGIAGWCWDAQSALAILP